MGWAGHNSPILQPPQHPSASPGAPGRSWERSQSSAPVNAPRTGLSPAASQRKERCQPSPAPLSSRAMHTQHHTAPHPSLHLSFLLQPWGSSSKREICLCQQGGQELRRDKSASAGVTVGQRDKKIRVGKVSGCREN